MNDEIKTSLNSKLYLFLQSQFVSMSHQEKSPLISSDPLLKPFEQSIMRRYQNSVLKEIQITENERLLSDCCNNHLYYGLHNTERGWVFREKAPHAKSVIIYGDFSYWKIEERYALWSIGNGDWEITLPYSFLRHGMLYKLWIVWHDGADERLPAYCRRVVQDEKTKIFAAQVWSPPAPWKWTCSAPPRPKHPLIYEAHIGMSSEDAKVSSYLEFSKLVLPRIVKLGYNTIQLMAVQEHPYYGSFGYQVSNFFAPSSRFGTPDELKELIDRAHQYHLSVILDIVHSHSVINEKEGLSRFDGSEYLYFHAGPRGFHPVWNSRCFNYGKNDTLLFLLSNLKYWLEEFHFDGFRFDGVTSMCYLDHGIGVDFLNYNQYFDDNVDEEALTYLSLAQKLVKQINNQAFTIAEDVSGMPGLAFPIDKGGIGFDYRMSMGIADYWTKIIKEIPDEQWHVGDIYFRLTDKRNEEEVISYAESHDQAMVGDQTIIFRLIGKKMYDYMSVFTPDLDVERGIALHKLIRFATLSLSNAGYLNFMGNEFGHPEWIDFPREGNNWSYQYARRQWHLTDNETLKYKFLNHFDQVIIHFITNNAVLDNSPVPIIQNNHDQVLAFRRGDFIFIFNFNPIQSFTDYEIGCSKGEYVIYLDSDDPVFGGFDRVDNKQKYPSYERAGNHYIRLYIPVRTTFVLKPRD